MMLLHILKKDFLLVKKYVLIMLVICAVIPLYFQKVNKSESAGPIGFILSAIYSLLILLEYVTMKELKYPKASALLCATPYPRRLLVLSKYMFCLVIFAATCLIFWVETLIFPELGGFPLELAALMFLTLAVFLGIYFPIQYKLGFEKTKYLFFLVIVTSPAIVSLLLKMDVGVKIDFLHAQPAGLLYGAAILIGGIVLAVSSCVSVSIYSKKDL